MIWDVNTGSGFSPTTDLGSRGKKNTESTGSGSAIPVLALVYSIPVVRIRPKIECVRNHAVIFS